MPSVFCIHAAPRGSWRDHCAPRCEAGARTELCLWERDDALAEEAATSTADDSRDIARVEHDPDSATVGVA